MMYSRQPGHCIRGRCRPRCSRAAAQSSLQRFEINLSNTPPPLIPWVLQ